MADYASLKNMWHSVFGDDEIVIDNFFQNTAIPENIIGAFNGNEALSALYMVDCTAVINKESYKAIYVYAVSTLPEFRGQGIMKELFSYLENIALEREVSLLFLVPAEESLFPMYEKLGYENVFCYQNRVENKIIPLSSEISVLHYGDYKAYRDNLSYDHIDLCEKGFFSFINPVGHSIKTISVKGEGYCVYEKETDGIIIHELFGNEQRVLAAVFSMENCESVTIREYPQGEGIPFGMYKTLHDIPISENMFFGIPYGG